MSAEYGCAGCGNERTGYACVNQACPLFDAPLCDRCAVWKETADDNRVFGCVLAVVVSLIALLVAGALGNLAIVVATGVICGAAYAVLRASTSQGGERFCCPQCMGDVRRHD